jgi:hypothetical protein
LVDEQAAVLAASRLDLLPPLWERWQLTIGALDAYTEPLVVAHNEQVEAALRPQLQRALAQFDRHQATLALRLVDASAMASKSLLELSSRVHALPVEGEPFLDPGGPPLLLVERPQEGRAGYALMQAPVTRELYAASGLPGEACKSTVSGTQGCIDHDSAERLAGWVSALTGRKYRLPSRSELRAAKDQLASMPMFAWTSECRILIETEKPGATKRAWGRIKSFFGNKPEPPKKRCAGHWTVALDGSAQNRAYENASPATTVVLLREVPPVAPALD